MRVLSIGLAPHPLNRPRQAENDYGNDKLNL